LGRQLYPELDLWTTAQPFLQKWLKDRYSPKTLLKQFKNDLPDLLEKLPLIPPMVFQALENLQQTSSDTEHKNPAPRAKQTNALGAVIAGLGLGLLATQWVAAIGPTLVIGSVITASGVLLMLFR